MAQRGRPRKYKWFPFQSLETEFSPEAQYLKWASANNSALQTLAATGCPRCRSGDFQLRHDKKFKIIRFYCPQCHHETSYRIKMPKPGSFQIVPILFNGIQIGDKILDTYHPATKRQFSDAIVLRASRGVERGSISLGGEWYVDGTSGGMHDQKRYFVNFEEITLICSWNKMQVEHEKRLRELEEDVVV